MDIFDTRVPTYFTSKHAVSMELRDYFAGQALAGLLANHKAMEANKDIPDWVERSVWVWADLVLERREKNNQ